MRRIIIFTLLALTTFGGVASADRWQQRDHRSGGVSVEPSRGHWRGDRGHWRGDRGRRYDGYRYQRPSYRYYDRVRYVRKPIYVRAPVIRYRYYDYAQRPAVIAENYSAMEGYYWVPGQWQWNGYEWIWQAGHYEPDPNYQAPANHHCDDGHCDHYHQSTNSGSYYDGSYQY